MTSYETRKFVVVSTAHLSEATAKSLDDQPNSKWPCLGGSYGEYGWFVYAHDENSAPENDAIPDDLFGVMTWARRKGFAYILFDCDADEVDGLPVHRW